MLEIGISFAYQVRQAEEERRLANGVHRSKKKVLHDARIAHEAGQNCHCQEEYELIFEQPAARIRRKRSTLMKEPVKFVSVRRG